MATDDERREVARRLREVQSYVIPGTKTEENPITGRIIGVACWYDLPDFQGLLGRLADLIEPSIDSDALLALANEMASFSRDSSCPSCAASGQPECSCGVECRESISHSAARRIREACGEVG